MVATQEKFVSASKSNVEALVLVAKTGFASVERVAALNLSAARNFMEQAAETAHAAVQIKTPEDLLSFQKGLAMPAIDNVVAYTRRVYEITAEAQGVLGGFFEERAGKIQGEIGTAIERAIKSAPVGSDVALATFKSVMDSANGTYEQVKKSTQQAIEMAESSAKSMADVTVTSFKAVA